MRVMSAISIVSHPMRSGMGFTTNIIPTAQEVLDFGAV